MKRTNARSSSFPLMWVFFSAFWLRHYQNFSYKNGMLKVMHVIRLFKGNKKLIKIYKYKCELMHKYIGHDARKPVFGVSDKASFKPVSSATQTR